MTIEYAAYVVVCAVRMLTQRRVTDLTYDSLHDGVVYLASRKKNLRALGRYVGTHTDPRFPEVLMHLQNITLMSVYRLSPKVERSGRTTFDVRPSDYYFGEALDTQIGHLESMGYGALGANWATSFLPEMEQWLLFAEPERHSMAVEAFLQTALGD